MIRQFVLISFTVLTTLSLLNCQSNDKKNTPGKTLSKADNKNAPTEDRLVKNQIQQELQEEQMLGKLLLENFVKDYGTYSGSQELNKYLQLTGSNISYQFGRSELVFKFAVLDTDEVNAYSLPGGTVLITRGLLEKVKNEGELAGIMGHEVAHINQKHIFKTVRKDREVGFAETLSSIISLGKSSMGNAMSQALGESMQLLTQSGMKAEQEFEADEYGVSFAAQAGYKADDYLQLLKRLKEETKANNLSNTHPPFEQRIAKIESLINSKSIANELRWNEQAINQRFNMALRKVQKPE